MVNVMIDIYDLLYQQALISGRESEFIAKFGTRNEHIKKYALEDEQKPDQ